MPERIVEFDEELHRYSLNGKVVQLSVTGVLGLTGFSDLSKIPRQILENKRKIGKHVHKATELLETVGLDWDSVRLDCLGYIAAYRKACADFKPKWHTIEKFGVMEVNGMQCGFMNDRGGYIDGRPWIVELKTSFAEEDWWKYQLAGYAIGAEEMPGQKEPYNIMAWQLKPDGTYRAYTYKDMAHNKAVFRSALHLASVHVSEGRLKKET